MIGKPTVATQPNTDNILKVCFYYYHVLLQIPAIPAAGGAPAGSLRPLRHLHLLEGAGASQCRGACTTPVPGQRHQLPPANGEHAGGARSSAPHLQPRGWRLGPGLHHPPEPGRHTAQPAALQHPLSLGGEQSQVEARLPLQEVGVCGNPCYV